LLGKLTHHPSGLIVAKDKSASPTWADVKALLLTFDRAGLQGLVQDLYAGSKDNQAFLHARFGLGPDQLGPYKATISRWINPDLMKNQTVSVSKAKKAIADCNWYGAEMERIATTMLALMNAMDRGRHGPGGAGRA